MFYSWNIIGHEKQLHEIEHDLTNNMLHHGYLFVGPSHIGKSTIIKQLAMILQCPNNFCRTCPTCIQVEKSSHADTIELLDDGESIKVLTIRDLLARLSMTSQSAYKIVIVENVKRFTPEAANALLKTLEEPTPKTIFLFTASSPDDVLPTIASRMRSINFKKQPIALLKNALHQQFPHIDESTIEYCINLSEDRSGRAINLLSDPEEFQALRDKYKEIEFHYEKKDFIRYYKNIGEMSKDAASTKQFLRLLTHFLRTRLLFSQTPRSPQESEKLLQSIERIHRAERLIEQNINARLVLEDILIRI